MQRKSLSPSVRTSTSNCASQSKAFGTCLRALSPQPATERLQSKPLMRTRRDCRAYYGLAVFAVARTTPLINTLAYYAPISMSWVTNLPKFAQSS